MKKYSAVYERMLIFGEILVAFDYGSLFVVAFPLALLLMATFPLALRMNRTTWSMTQVWWL